MEKINEDFTEKIAYVNQQHVEEISKYKDKIQNIDSLHAEEIKQLRENHSRIIDEIKYEQSTLLENIKHNKQSETSLFAESNTYLQKLDSNIEILYHNSKSLSDLKESVEKDYGILSKAREETLKAREKEIIRKFVFYHAERHFINRCV